MKVNITVDVDWLDEEGSIDERIQEDIVLGVKKAISRDCLKSVEEQTKEAIDTGMEEAIQLMETKVTNFFAEWLDTEATITDNYGDKVKYGSLRDIIKDKFNECINQKVDKDGRPTNYGSAWSRLEFITGAKVKEVVDDYLSSYQRDIDKTIKETIEAGIKSRVSDKFAEMVIGYAKQDFENQKAIEQKIT